LAPAQNLQKSPAEMSKLDGGKGAKCVPNVITKQEVTFCKHTVDGRNLAPPDMSPDMYETIMGYIYHINWCRISSINSMMQSFINLPFRMPQKQGSQIDQLCRMEIILKPTLRETKISHLSKRKIIFKSAFKRRYVSCQEGSKGTLNQPTKPPPK